MSADAFVRCAREQIGKQYKWGTAGPNTFDCSGLTSYCYEQVTHEPMTRSSHQQILLGERVPLETARPGDLVFYGTDGTDAGHVAVYAGDDRIIHAMNEQRDVIESNINAPMGGPLTQVRRLEFHEESTEPPKARRRRRPKRKRR